jgi:hypothetical protein
MHSLSEEIEKRIQSDSWSKKMAGKVMFERSRRRKRSLAVTGSLFVVFLLSFIIGFDFSKTGSVSSSWNENFISSVTEAVYPQVVPQDVDEFISYAFNGQ